MSRDGRCNGRPGQRSFTSSAYQQSSHSIDASLAFQPSGRRPRPPNSQPTNDGVDSPRDGILGGDDTGDCQSITGWQYGTRCPAVEGGGDSAVGRAKRRPSSLGVLIRIWLIDTGQSVCTGRHLEYSYEGVGDHPVHRIDVCTIPYYLLSSRTLPQIHQVAFYGLLRRLDHRYDARSLYPQSGPQNLRSNGQRGTSSSEKWTHPAASSPPVVAFLVDTTTSIRQ